MTTRRNNMCVTTAQAMALVAAAWTATAAAQGYNPNEAARKMTAAEGLKVELAASEPLVRQPVAIDFDDRGRLWVLQYLQYPNPAGLAKVSVDRFSRTTYDRVPDPPPRGPKGSDAITILTDADGDGRMDHAKHFVTGLNLASGFAFGHGGVFVLQTPYLLFYPDRDRDDVPDSDPEALLTGFGMEDAHSVANSLTWGPDGWLYGCQGSTVTARIRGIEFQQGVWRYHPVTRRFELFCEGGGNSWGLDFDAHGNLLYSTNYGGFVMLHGVQGAYYWKMFGKHGALHNPHAYGFFDHVKHHNFQGGHVTVGGLVYRGHTLPANLVGKYIGADLLGHAIYWHDVEPLGSTVSSRHGGLIAAANDTWFAPSDVCVGPDGAVCVADWHDKRTTHPDPEASWDRSNGRIFRIQAAGAPRPKLPDLASMTSNQLVGLLDSKNYWLASRARRMLAERRDVELVLPLRSRLIATSRDPAAVELLWALYASGGLSDAFARELLAHRSADVRRWTVRLVGDELRPGKQVIAAIVEMAGREPDVTVRSQLACTARRLDADAAVKIVVALGRHSEDQRDLHLPLLLWWAVEEHATRHADVILARFAIKEAWDQPLLRAAVLGRLVRRYAAENTAAGYDACARLLASAPSDELRRGVVADLALGLSEQSAGTLAPGAGTLFTKFGVAQRSAQAETRLGMALPPRLQAMLERLWQTSPHDQDLMRLMARLGDAVAQQRTAEVALGPREPAGNRIAAIKLLGEVRAGEYASPLVELVAGRESDEIKLAALDALQNFNQDSVAEGLISLLNQLGPGLRARTADVLLSRRAWTHKLLAAVDQGSLPEDILSTEQLRLVPLHQDAQLNALVQKRWGSIKEGTPEEKLALMRQWANDLRAEHGDAGRGKDLFTKTCAACHRLFDSGNAVGPDLTHANRSDRDYLLASIVDPSAIIRKEYMNYVVMTSSGRVLTGLIAEQTPAGVTLLDARGERTTVAAGELDAIKPSPQSLMPEDLLKPLAPGDVRDLFSYLQSQRPPSGKHHESAEQAN